MSVLSATAATLFFWPFWCALAATPVTGKVDFARDIQPIFSNRCYECHGEKKQKSDFRLDDRTIALRGGESAKPAIIPGNSAESPLIQRVTSTNPDESMPQKGERLSTGQIALLKTWIDEGAHWPDQFASSSGRSASAHWGFKQPVKAPLPEVKSPNWVRNPIDSFIIARLENEKRQPSPEADKVTLLRRLSLDLLGLPPTIAEVDAFVADKGAEAYERQVERLLKSPHFGERWCRHWLDAARYADSDGYEADRSREIWFYRDWVINAFNRDLPYDQFIMNQIAGDLLPDSRQDQIVATGFLRNSMVNEEGAIDYEQFRMEAMIDRMDAIGKSVLGLTIQCAQCHNHKYDPLTQEEYYRLLAFINNDHEARPVVYTPEETVKIESIRQEIQDIETDLRRRTSDWEQRMAEWEKRAETAGPEWVVLDPEEHGGVGGGTRYYKLKDSSVLCLGHVAAKVVARVRAKTALTNISAFRLEVLTDPNLPMGGPGRSFKGTFALTEFKAEAAPLDAPTNKTKIKFSEAAADYSQPESPLEPVFFDKSDRKRVVGPINFAIDGNADTAWAIDAGPGRRNVERKAVFQVATNPAFNTGTEITFLFEQMHGGWNNDDNHNNLIGRMRLSVTSAPKPVAPDPLPKTVRDILAIPADRRSPVQRAAVFGFFRTTVPEFAEANQRIDELMSGWPIGSSTLALQAREEPRATHILKRGDFFKPGKQVSAGVPAFLHPLPKESPPTRLTFATWLTDRQSPTTARVIVNRIWQEYFGVGLVSTPEDFGMRVEAQSHPELLDWLACEFMDRGWSLKAMHRLIVTSATYRQSSKVTQELYEHDPYNRLLARGPRFRVDGEIVRDIALAASGLLTPKIGGPSVYPPAPQFLFAPPASFGTFTWNEETGADRYRRALYTFRRRSTPYPMLQNFDAPNGESSCVRRGRSNTPVQALTTLNEPLFVEAAQALALRTLVEGGASDVGRATYAFRLCVGRKPTPAEIEELLALLKKQEERLSEGWLEAKQVAYIDPAKPPALPKGSTPKQLAAWTIVSRVVLNLDEAITKE